MEGDMDMDMDSWEEDTEFDAERALQNQFQDLNAKITQLDKEKENLEMQKIVLERNMWRILVIKAKRKLKRKDKIIDELINQGEMLATEICLIRAGTGNLTSQPKRDVTTATATTQTHDIGNRNLPRDKQIITEGGRSSKSGNLEEEEGDVMDSVKEVFPKKSRQMRKPKPYWLR